MAGLSLSGAWLYVQKQKNKTQVRWPKASFVACVALIVPVSVLPIIWIYLHRVGGKVDGQYQMVDLPDAVAAFIVGWAIVTLIIELIWIIGVFSLERGTGQETRRGGQGMS
jgi:ABC-type sulfate transport system permease subunit